MFRVALLLAFLGCSPLLADEVALVRVGENWRYLKGTNEASTPVTAWRQTGFDDSVWLTGQSGFGYSSFGAATILTDLPLNYLSVFFRKKFTILRPETVKWLILRVDYDDGFVAYLNGVEIVRRGFPGPAGSSVPYNAAAAFHSAGAAEEIDVTPFTNLLVAGDNVLAIQTHNSSLTSFSFTLVPELLANFQRGPFIQNASTNQIQVIWKTPVPSDTKVEFGTNGSLGNALFDTNLVTTHVATLTNLASNTSYSYRVSSSDGGAPGVSPVETFRTLKTDGSLSFVLFGDSGWGSSAQFEIARVVKSLDPDLVLHSGDVIYGSFTSELADTRCLSVYAPHMKNTPYYFTLGNHDLYSGAKHYLDAFYLPTNSVSATNHFLAGTSPEHYYSFEHGDAHFTVLFVPYLSQYKLSVGDSQYNWLTNDLATTTKPWKILLFHVPMNSSSGHRFDDNDYNGIPDRLDIKNVVLPVASRYNVQLILSGHEHGYERFNPINGVHSITSAGGGVPLYGFTELDVASAFFWSRYNCVRFTINGDTLEAQAIGLGGEVFDSMTIQRALPPPQIYSATWNSPVLETTPPDDAQGNVSGQRLDFRESPIPTLTGKFSNLGRVYVNNDRTNVYVGFEQVMIYKDNNVFLFLESPRLQGVTNLLAVGNGIVDPEAEGADGLDFLANLSFTNFAPSLGCVLGDELADGQYRSFARSNLMLNIGQGVFKLDAGLSDVPGIRLQQFHSSPQLTSLTGEENANFIELAIPLRELGELQPGDIIKIGAVVGGEQFKTNQDQQTRLLDSGFLGTQLAGIAPGPIVLEGVSVTLAFGPDRDYDGLTDEQELAQGTDPAIPDSDGDGLLDGWEVRNGLNPLSAVGDNGAAADPDHDGFLNSEEQMAATDPLDRDSVLRMTLTPLGNRRNRISWSAVVSKKYELDFADYPFTNFVNLAPGAFPRIAASTFESFEDAIPLSNTQLIGRLYRVRVVP